MARVLPDGSLRCAQTKRTSNLIRSFLCDSIATKVFAPYGNNIADAIEHGWARNYLHCNLHAGAVKRSNNGRDLTFIPIADAPPELLAAARKEYEAVDRRDIEQAAKEAVEQDAQYNARITREWSLQDATFEVRVRQESWHREDQRFIEVVQTGGSDHWADVYRIEVSGGDPSLPAVARIMGGGDLSPNRARAVAEALGTAADMVAALNADRV